MLFTQGDSYEEVIDNIQDATKLYVEDRLENGEDILQAEYVILTMMEVSVWQKSYQE